MRFKPTLILLAIAVAAVVYLVVVELPSQRDRTADEEKEKQLTQILGEEIFGVELRRSGDTLAFVRTGFDWEMTAPVRDHADMASVNVSVLSVTKANIEERFQADASQLAEYRLADPVLTITLYDTAQTAVIAVDVGDLNLTKSHCYVRVHGSDEILIVPAGVRRYSLLSDFDYREKRIVEFEVSDVSEVSIRSEVQASDWARSETGAWYTTLGGDTIRGDGEAIDIILRELRALRATSITDPPVNPSRTLLDAGTIAVTTKDSTRTVLRFSEPDSSGSWVTSSGTDRIASVDPSALDVFQRTFDDTRDRHILNFDPNALGKITLDTGAATTTILKAESSWTFANPTLGEIEPEKVTALLQTLKTMKYREVLKERPTDATGGKLADAVFHLSLFDANQRLVDEVTAGPLRSPGRTHLATSRSAGFLGVVDSELLDEIQHAFEQFLLE